jgi:hypothetical protein
MNTFVFKNIVFANNEFNETIILEKEFEYLFEACDFAKEMTGKDYSINCDGHAANIPIDSYNLNDNPIVISLAIEEKGFY